MSIVPNPFNGTAQVTLTVQVTNPGIVVKEGVVSVTLAGQSANGAVANGTASVQLSVPSSSLIGNPTISLSYADNSAAALFEPSGTAETVSLNLLNALLPATVTVTSGGGELDAMPFFFAMLDFFYTNQQLTEIGLGPLGLHVQYLDIGGQTLVTLNGIPWQVQLFGPQGQFLGTVPLVPIDNELMALLSAAL